MKISSEMDAMKAELRRGSISRSQVLTRERERERGVRTTAGKMSGQLEDSAGRELGTADDPCSRAFPQPGAPLHPHSASAQPVEDEMEGLSGKEE